MTEKRYLPALPLPELLDDGVNKLGTIRVGKVHWKAFRKVGNVVGYYDNEGIYIGGIDPYKDND